MRKLISVYFDNLEEIKSLPDKFEFKMKNINDDFDFLRKVDDGIQFWSYDGGWINIFNWNILEEGCFIKPNQCFYMYSESEGDPLLKHESNNESNTAEENFVVELRNSAKNDNPVVLSKSDVLKIADDWFDSSFLDSVRLCQARLEVFMYFKDWLLVKKKIRTNHIMNQTEFDAWINKIVKDRFIYKLSHYDFEEE